jgi:hypothetical protein
MFPIEMGVKTGLEFNVFIINTSMIFTSKTLTSRVFDKLGKIGYL